MDLYLPDNETNLPSSIHPILPIHSWWKDLGDPSTDPLVCVQNFPILFFSEVTIACRDIFIPICALFWVRMTSATENMLLVQNRPGPSFVTTAPRHIFVPPHKWQLTSRLSICCVAFKYCDFILCIVQLVIRYRFQNWT